MSDMPDLMLYRLIHRGMRRSSAQLRDAVRTLHPGDRDRAGAIARWYRGFAAELHTHHHVEDHVFFPALAERDPGFGHLGPDLDVDHVHLARMIDGITAALARLADGGPWARAWQQALALTGELAAHLEEHLDVEDLQVLPQFEARFTATEYDDLGKRAAKAGSMKDLAWTVPWVVGLCNEAERQQAFASAPSFMRLVWLLTRRRFERLEAAAFGPPAPRHAAQPALAAS